VTSRQGTGKSINFFYSVGKGMVQKHVSKKHKKKNGWEIEKRTEKNVREWNEQERP
jgi:hypothetical protein